MRCLEDIVYGHKLQTLILVNPSREKSKVFSRRIHPKREKFFI